MRSRVFAVLSFGAIALVGACASYAGSTGQSHINEAPSPDRTNRPTGMSAREERDSIFAQMLADREGPRVKIQAQYTSLVAGSRRLRAAFRVEDDAYVLIGHVDAEGVVRIVFPSTPDDNGFVKGGRSYQSAEFFGGFTDAYRYRAQTYGRFAAFRPDAYDQQFGHLFIIASWRPMNTQQFATEGRWDSFEISDRDMYDDPKPAIYELAALAAGENREAYTVEFARYYSTMNLATGGYGSSIGSAFCTSGFANWRVFGYPSLLPIDLVGRLGYNTIQYHRGRAYFYDSFAGCYSPAPYGFPYFQPRIAVTPPVVQPGTGIPTRGRVFSADDSPRQPIEPRPPVGSPRVAPVQARDIGPVDVVPSSPRYRDRGLITDDDNPTPPSRQPRVQVQAENTRPSISKMTERRVREATDENSYRGGNTRARVNYDGGPPVIEPPRQRVRENTGGNSGNEGRTYSPRPENASPPREPIAQPRVAAPVAEPRPTAPTPPPPAPRTEPPSTGAGSSIRPITPG